MKRFQLLIIIVLSIYSLAAIPVLCKHWHELKKPNNYPLYEMVDKHQMEPDEKLKYTQKRQKIYRDKKEINYEYKESYKTNSDTGNKEKYYTLYDVNGNELWSISAGGYYTYKTATTAPNGISLVSKYDENCSLAWLDLQGNVLNKFPVEKFKNISPRALADGEYWMVSSVFDNDEIPKNNVENPDQSRLYFFDSTGNLLNQIDLKYKKLFREMTVSDDEKLIMFTCYKDWTKGRSLYYSYYMKSNGTIIKEYDNLHIGDGRFSEDNSLYKIVDYAIMDAESGNIISNIPGQGPSATSNKGANILAIYDSHDLRIINFETKELLYEKRFKYPGPNYIEVSGDGKEIILTMRNSFQKYRLKSSSE